MLDGGGSVLFWADAGIDFLGMHPHTYKPYLEVQAMCQVQVGMQSPAAT